MIFLNAETSHMEPLAPSMGTPSSSVATKMIQELNNKACVLITIGDYAMANQLLGLALENHKRAVAGSQCFGGLRCFDDYDTTPIDDEYDYDDDDMDTSSNDTFDFSHDCPRDQTQGLTNSPPSSGPITHSVTSQLTTSKMTTCTQVRTMPCASQQQDSRFPASHNYHKVYSTPIVMDDSEWENTSADDRSFTLVFNSAISNHLWGMNLLSSMGTNYSKGPFETAKALYLLALETLWSTGSTSGLGGGRIRSVDKLCVPAIFNNLSHASKVLDGYSSREASVYDSVLVKSVFWWIDGNSSVYASSPANSPNLRRASDGDEEVIEAFLDTVFYLIGEPASSAPAAAA